MTKEVALEIQAQALRAIEALTSSLEPASQHCSPEEYKLVKRGVGLSIGRIQLELLDFIYALFPDLDHLKNRNTEPEANQKEND